MLVSESLLITMVFSLLVSLTALLSLSFYFRYDKNKSKKRIEDSEKKYNDLVEKTNIGHSLFDMHCNVLYANSHYSKMAGFEDVSEIIGRNVKEWIHPSKHGSHNDMLRALKEESEVKGFEMSYYRKDGTEIDIEINAFISDGESGKIVVVHCQDITLQKQHEKEMSSSNEELVARNKELDAFTYIASHDLQEPSKKLMALCSLLKYDIGEHIPNKSKSDIECIIKTAARMQDLVRDLLDLSQIGRDDIKKKELCIEGCIDDAIAGLSLKIRDTGAKIIKEEFVSVCGNDGLITQLYHNLISNSLKFMLPGITPEIHLTCCVYDDGNVVFGVKDNGIGIPDEHKDDIFQTFKRMYTRDQYEGNGIGLSICKKIVEHHGGRLWIDKDFEYGSYFKFSLPAVSECKECKAV